MNSKGYSQSQSGYKEEKQSCCQKLQFWMHILFYYLNLGSHFYLIFDVIVQINYEQFNDSQSSYWVYLFIVLIVCMTIERIKSYFLTYEFLKLRNENIDMNMSYQSSQHQVQDNEQNESRIVSFFLSFFSLDFVYMKWNCKVSGQLRIVLRKEITHMYAEGILFSLVGFTLIQTKIIWGEKVPEAIIVYTLISCIYCLYVVYLIQIDKIVNSNKFEQKWLTPFSIMNAKTQKHISNPFTLGALTQNLEANIIYPELFTLEFLKFNKLLPAQQYEMKLKRNYDLKKYEEKKRKKEKERKEQEEQRMLEEQQSGKKMSRAQKLRLKKQQEEEEKERIRKEKIIEQKFLMKISQQLIEESGFMLENSVQISFLKHLYILFIITSHFIGYGSLLVMQIMTDSTIDLYYLLVIGFILYFPKILCHIQVILKNKQNEGLFIPLGWFLFNFPYLPLYGLVQLFTPVKSDKIPFIKQTSETWAHNFLPSFYISGVKQVFQIFWLLTVQQVLQNEDNYDTEYIPDITRLTEEGSDIKILFTISLITVIINTIFFVLLLIDQLYFYIKLKKSPLLKQQIFERKTIMKPNLEEIEQKFKEKMAAKEKQKQEKDRIKGEPLTQEQQKEKEDQQKTDAKLLNKQQSQYVENYKKDENTENLGNQDENNEQAAESQQKLKENDKQEIDNNNEYQESFQGEIPSENLSNMEKNQEIKTPNQLSEVKVVLAPDSQRVQLIKSQQNEIQHLFNKFDL